MVEVHLLGAEWGIAPTENGKQLTLKDKESGFVYVMPFPHEAIESMVEYFSMSNEDLELLIQERNNSNGKTN